MLKFINLVSTSETPITSLTLPYDRRIISRQRVELDNGQEAGLFLPRGTVLQADDVLASETGEHISIIAAAESVSSIYSEDALLLARACYHLGNRHVPLQIESGMVRYQHDHVLDDMVRGLGLEVTVEQASFEPEAGAYGGHHHSHEHSHDDHAHNHDHSHSHAH